MTILVEVNKKEKRNNIVCSCVYFSVCMYGWERERERVCGGKGNQRRELLSVWRIFNPSTTGKEMKKWQFILLLCNYFVSCFIVFFYVIHCVFWLVKKVSPLSILLSFSEIYSRGISYTPHPHSFLSFSSTISTPFSLT